MAELLTFCFTDIEGSTAHLRAVGQVDYEILLERQRDLIRAALKESGGAEITTEGDGFFLAFDDAAAALAFAASAQRALTTEPWPTPLRVRMGMHAGPAERRPDGDFVAMAVHQAARVAGTAHGGQIVFTPAVLDGAELPPDTSVEPLGSYRVRDFDQPVELLQLAGDGLRRGFPPLRAARADHGLRVPRAVLVGRERELAQLVRLITAHPLVTLTGPGGVGKTRLALEAAVGAAGAFPDGLHLVEPSSVAGPAALGAAVAAAVSARPDADVDPLDAAAAAIGTSRRLVVFDSCEHWLDAVANAVDVLGRACPNLAFLATSIEPIRMPEERIVIVEPLAPDGAGVQLLLQRATEAGADLGVPTSADLEAATEIARRLDGIPLAIELAAGRIVERGVAAVLDALDDRFALLTNGYRTALPRHRTLEAMVAWSVEQLKPDAADLLVRLSVLRGRWERDAALEVCGGSMGMLQQLIDRSLVALDHGPPERIRLLDTVRAFAARQLTAADAGALFAAKLSYLSERMQLTHVGDHLDVVDPFAADVDEVLFDAADDVAGRARLAAGVAGWYERRGEGPRIVTLLEALLERLSPGATRAEAAVALSMALRTLGDQERATEIAEIALAEAATPPIVRALAHLAATPLGVAPPVDGEDRLAQALALVDPRSRVGLEARGRIAHRKLVTGDAAGAAADYAGLIVDARAGNDSGVQMQAHHNRGAALVRLGDLDEAQRELELARRMAIDGGARNIVGSALANLSSLALQRGDAPVAMALAHERLTLARELHSALGEAAALSTITGAAIALGDFATARAAADECAVIARRTGNTEALASTGFNRVVLAVRDGDHAGAARRVVELIDDVAGANNPALTALALYAAGGVTAGAGLAVGLELLAAADAHSPAQMPFDPSDRVWLDECRAAAVDAVGPADAEAANARGAALDADAAMALAGNALRDERPEVG